MEVELMYERVRQASSMLADVDVAGLDAHGVRSVLGELRTERAHSGRLEMALAARAGKLRDACTGDDPIDLSGGSHIFRWSVTIHTPTHLTVLRRQSAGGRSATAFGVRRTPPCFDPRPLSV